jgi:tellurite resistance protein TerC
MPHALWGWVAFHLIVFALLALDLGVFHRRAHTVSVKEALAWSGVWIGTSLAFNLALYVWMGPGPATQFLAGYVLEKSLSVDNIFVILLIFTYFRVPERYQHKILYWGILGALVMRALLIGVGVTLLHRFHWIVYGFGALLLYGAWKMVSQRAISIAPDHNPVVRLFRRVMGVSSEMSDGAFFVTERGKRLATPLFIALLTIETADLAFAIDSIPAVFAVSEDAFIVYTSNIFAILGLRSLYFALAGVLHHFTYFRYGLGAVLAFVGAKMLLSGVLEVPVPVTLAVIAACLGVAVAASVWWKPAPEAANAPAPAEKPAADGD